MALRLDTKTDRIVSVDEFVDFVNREVDLYDVDSIASAAPMLRGLANDPDLISNRLHTLVARNFDNAGISSTESIYLGGGKDFYLRANAWPTEADIKRDSLYQQFFQYGTGHDHNWHFMTVGYFGPGYETDLYEYDRRQVQGYVGEAVDLKFLRRDHLQQGDVLLFRAARDVHRQWAPASLSVTINFMIGTPDTRTRDQYFFDVDRKIITSDPGGADAAVRVSLIKLAASAVTPRTQQWLDAIADGHPCALTRLGAFEALVTMPGADAGRVWERAARDADRRVSDSARVQLGQRREG